MQPAHWTEASHVNPSAGSHVITDDYDELRACRRAADASLAEFPYYVERYGERGRLFGTSDGAWMVTLVDDDEAERTRQVLWLGGVLAARGMPHWLLERHLELLHAELAAAKPDDAARYAPLLAAAALLRERRRAALPDDVFEAVGRAFDEAVGADAAARLPQMGRILAAAVADERAGTPEAVESLVSWCTDPERFPRAWIRAVESAVAQARRAAGTAGA